MDQFINQLNIYTPLAANCLIKIENRQESIDEEIEIYKHRIESKNHQMKNEKAKEFLSKNLINYQQQLSSELSKTIRSIDEINFEFEKFEVEILRFKERYFIQIEQMINDYNEMNILSTKSLVDLLGETRMKLKVFNKMNKECLINKSKIDQNIPLVNNELLKLNEQHKNLEEQYFQLKSLADQNHKLLDTCAIQLASKRQNFNRHYQANKQLKNDIQTHNGQLVEAKSQARLSIFEYLSKIKQLANLTEEKNCKVDEFRNLIKKYSKESIINLNMNKDELKNKIDELNDKLFDEKVETLDDHSDQSKRTRQQKDTMPDYKQVNTIKLIKQVKDKNLKSKLNSLNNLYDKVIIKKEDELKSKMLLLKPETFN